MATTSFSSPARSRILLLFLLGALPAGAVEFFPNPFEITAGAATLTVDIQRIPLPGERAGYDDDELDTFEWFAPSDWPTGPSVRLPRAAIVRPDTVRVQIPAELLKGSGFAYIVYTMDPAVRRERQAISVYLNRAPHIEGTLAAGAVGTRMSQTLEAVDGSGPFQWSIASGSLPPGVALVGRAQSADFVGVPTTAGSYTFALRVVDKFRISAEKSYTLTIAAPPGPPVRISTAALPSATVGIPYQAPLQATGGTAPYQWSSTGGLPPGLSISASGVLSGTPTSAGTYNVAVRAVDAAGVVDQKTFALAVEAIVTLMSFNAASFESGVAAPESLVSGFANLPPGALTVSVRDTGARVLFNSSSQINYLVPAGLATGTATVTVRVADRIVATGTLSIQSVAPGLFTANADGKGVAAATYIRGSFGAQSAGSAFTCASSGGCQPQPIDLGGENDSVYLAFYGTGIRGRTALSGVTATVGGEPVPAVFAGPQSEFQGVDQVNLGPLPRTLASRGTVTVQLTVDGKNANPVMIAVR